MFRHLYETKSQLAMLKGMLHQQRTLREQTSEPATVGDLFDSSASNPSQPVTDQAAGGSGLFNTSQWYDQ